MGNKRYIITLILLTTWTWTWAKEVTDTLESSKRDRVIVTYDITQNSGKVVIKFLDVKKKLGQTFREKYKKLDEVAVLFFDRIGNYEDKMEFSGINTDAFMIPKEISYKVSRDGYFLLNDNPTLSLELKSSESAELSIPMYLAHYEKKRHYKVFSRCEDLVVKLSKRKLGNMPDNTTSQLTTQTITSEEELDGAFSEADEARILMSKINDLLQEQDEYPFSDELRQAISSLRDRSYRIQDNELSSKISDVLAACKIKEARLKEEADAVARDAELEAKKAEQQAIARQDSIAAAAEEKAEEDKKRNLWLIIGGVVLAILGFVGNQVLQHLRNAKNQKSIMDMQANVVKQAENEAKRRARNMAQSQINQIEREARKAPRNIINNIIGKTGKEKGKKNKRISI